MLNRNFLIRLREALLLAPVGSSPARIGALSLASVGSAPTRVGSHFMLAVEEPKWPLGIQSLK